MVAKLYQFIPSLWENLQFTEKKTNNPSNQFKFRGN